MYNLIVVIKINVNILWYYVTIVLLFKNFELIEMVFVGVDLVVKNNIDKIRQCDPVLRFQSHLKVR